MYDRAEWTVTLDTEPPGEDATWQAIDLPDAKATQRHEGASLGRRARSLHVPQHWYRFRLELDEPLPERLALYVPAYKDRAAVYVNGIEVHRSYLDPEQITHGWNTPLWVALPQLSLKSGDNEILLRLDSPYAGEILMARPRIGHPLLMETMWRSAYEWRISSPKIACWMLAGLGLFAIGLWSVRRQETVHLLLGLSSLSFSARQLHYFVQEPFVSPEFFWWVATASLSWTMLFLFLFVLRYYDMRQPRVESLLIAASVLTSLVIFPEVGFEAYDVAAYIYVLLMPIGLLTAIIILKKAWQQHGLPQILLATGFVINVIAGLHDLLVMTRILSFERPYLLPISAALMLFCFVLALAGRYLGSLREVEELNRSLEARVREREAELTRSFERLRELGEDQVLTEERQRLMREIHDGIGANLIATLATVERHVSPTNPTVNALRRAIADLKLTIDSLEPVDGDLPSLLGNLRYRLTPQLREAGIEIQWRVTPLPPLDWLRAPQALHVLRILQEAFGNIIQHAGATQVEVVTGTSRRHPDGGAEGVLISLRDNGCGLHRDCRQTSHGKGIENMRWRAAALDGHLDITDSPEGGAELRLWLPLRGGEPNHIEQSAAASEAATDAPLLPRGA